MGKRGPMPGTGGRPKEAITERIANGNPGYKPIKVIPAPSTYEGVDIPISILMMLRKNCGRWKNLGIHRLRWRRRMRNL